MLKPRKVPAEVFRQILFWAASCNARLAKESLVFKSFLAAGHLFPQYLPQASSVFLVAVPVN